MPTTENIIGYWKFNEGLGSQAKDVARNRHMNLATTSWYLNNQNKALALANDALYTKNDAVAIYLAECSVRNNDDYAVEMWFRAEKEQNNEVAYLFDTDAFGVVLENGKMVLNATQDDKMIMSMGNKQYNDANWHHFAMNVLRSGNAVVYIDGSKKAADAVALTEEEMAKNVVMFAEDGAGYVTFTDGLSLTGLVKVEDGERAQIYTDVIDETTIDAIEAYLGEDYEAIIEYYNFAGTGFKNDVAFTYEAYAEDPHFFYAWDGEKFVDLNGKYNHDENVDAYEFTAAAKGIIIVTDVEIVAAAADTKNPDTGANDVVGVAAALAVVSLVAAGAVSLKK
jgi:hypothetical protein